MSPSELSWTQGFLFLFLGIIISAGIKYCVRKWRTRQGTSDVELSSIHIGNDTGRSPLVRRGGGDEEGRSPPNQASVVFTALPSQPDRTTTFRPDHRRLRRSQRSKVRRLKREQANNTADSTSTAAWVFSTPPVLQQLPPSLVPEPSLQFVELFPNLEETIPQLEETLPQLEETLPQLEETLPQLEETLPQLEDHDQAKTFEGLRHRPSTSTQRRVRAAKWTHQEKDAVLELMQEALTIPKGKNRWDFISEALVDRYGFDRSSKSCQEMGDVFQKLFRAIQNHESMKSRSSNWTSYWEMDEDVRSKHGLPKSFSLKWYNMMESIRAARGRQARS